MLDDKDEFEKKFRFDSPEGFVIRPLQQTSESWTKYKIIESLAVKCEVNCPFCEVTNAAQQRSEKGSSRASSQGQPQADASA